jgi:hypothetical protein
MHRVPAPGRPARLAAGVAAPVPPAARRVPVPVRTRGLAPRRTGQGGSMDAPVRVGAVGSAMGEGLERFVPTDRLRTRAWAGPGEPLMRKPRVRDRRLPRARDRWAAGDESLPSDARNAVCRSEWASAPRSPRSADEPGTEAMPVPEAAPVRLPSLHRNGLPGVLGIEGSVPLTIDGSVPLTIDGLVPRSDAESIREGPSPHRQPTAPRRPRIRAPHPGRRDRRASSWARGAGRSRAPPPAPVLPLVEPESSGNCSRR